MSVEVVNRDLRALSRNEQVARLKKRFILLRDSDEVAVLVSGQFAQIGYLGGFWGQASGSDYARARRYLKELGSDHLQEQEFGTLPQSEQQKVLIARARMTKPYSIILDEPCAGMDRGARELFSFAAESRWPEKNAGVDLRDPHHIEEISAAVRKDAGSAGRQSALYRTDQAGSQAAGAMNWTHPFLWFGEKDAIGRLQK